jgi:hypothetical protein
MAFGRLTMAVLAVLFVVCCAVGWWCFAAFVGLTGVKLIGRALRPRESGAQSLTTTPAPAASRPPWAT